MNPFAALIDYRRVQVAPAKPPRQASEPRPRRSGIAHPNPWGLSWLQSEVVLRLGSMSIDAIGRELRIGNKTVETAIERAKEKAGVDTRRHLVEAWERHINKEH